MTYERFLKIVTGIQKVDQINYDLYKLGVDVSGSSEIYQTIVSELFHDVWTPEGVDWLEWFMWESDFGKNGCTSHEADGTPICYDFESTWKYLQQYEVPGINLPMEKQ
jgi:hypothetical protein